MYWACGFAGMSVKEFWSSEIRHVVNVILGKQRLQSEERKSMFEAARFSAWHTVNAHLMHFKTSRHFPTAQEFFAFSWEEELLESIKEDRSARNLAQLERMRKVVDRDLAKLNRKKTDASTSGS